MDDITPHKRCVLVHGRSIHVHDEGHVSPSFAVPWWLWQRTNSQVGMVHVSFTFVDRLVCGGVGLTSMDEPSIAIDG